MVFSTSLIGREGATDFPLLPRVPPLYTAYAKKWNEVLGSAYLHVHVPRYVCYAIPTYLHSTEVHVKSSHNACLLASSWQSLDTR